MISARRVTVSSVSAIGETLPRRTAHTLRNLLRLAVVVFAGSAAMPGTAVAQAQQQSMQVLHNHVRPAVLDRRAAFAGAMPQDQQLHLSVVLPLRNQAALTTLLGRLYDPTSPDYRQFLSVDQFTEQFGPTAADYQAVVSYVQASGFTVDKAPANRLVVPISGTVAQINSAFNLQMNTYQHPTENRTFFSPDREPSLRLNVAISHISGLDDYSLPHHMSILGPKTQANGVQAATVTGSGPNGSYLGSDMRAAYYGGTTLTGVGQSVGILEFGGYALSDVDRTFFNAGQTYTVPINNVLLDGASGGSVGQDGEQTLDIVQAIGMAPGLSQVRVYIGIGSDDANILNSMASENIAKQLSCSWGWRPADPVTDDVFFQEMAAQGQTFFTASGDDGAFDVAISPFFYPAEDQYVTTVGGTHLTTNGAAGTWVSETAWNSEGKGTGGGISPDNISIPSWQVGLANSANGGSTTLRNVPDVAMEGDFDNYVCSLGTCETNSAGTSFATPRWAGFMALINQQAVEAGTAPKGGLGFINPTVYQLAQGANAARDLHDVVSGNNDTGNQPVWFNAVVGYDLATGWGSANGQHLIDDMAGPQTPGFWLASAQSTVGVNPGESGTATISVTDAGGFTGTVNFAVTSTLPTGVTASFSPNPTTGTTVLTLKASSSAPVETATVTVTGTSGSLSATTNLTVAVHGPSFSLTASPNSLGLNQGASGTSTITVTDLYGFTGAVNLSITGLPTGVTGSFSPASTSGTSTLTLTASNTAIANNVAATITATSGSLTTSIPIYVTIHSPTFFLQGTSGLNIGQGTSSIATYYVEPQYGFTGSVNVAVTGLPAGVTAQISPNPTTYETAITFTASSSAAIGSTPVTITGTSGSLTSSTTLTLGILAPSFTLYSAGTVNVGQGSSGNAYVNVSGQYGFNGSVVLSVAGLPSGVTALWNPNPTTGSSSLTLAANSSVMTGQYPLTITGTSGSSTAKTTLTLGIYAPTFTLNTYGGVTIGQGNSATSYVYVTPQYGFTGSVNLSISGLPAGVTGSFSTNPVSAISQLTLKATSTATTGQYTATITGTYGTQTVNTTLTVSVFAPTFTLSAGSVNIGQGTSYNSYVYVTPQYGFTGSVNLSLAGLPAGVSGTFTPNPSTGYTTLLLTATSAAATGQYTVTVNGTSGSQTGSTTFTLGIFKPTFTLYTNGSVTLGQGTSSTSYVSLNSLYGFTGSVNLSVAGLPSGVTAAFGTNPTTSSSLLTLTANGTAPVGQYTLVITGTSGTQTSSANLTLNIGAPTFTLYASGASIGQGSSGNGYVYVTDVNGFSGNVNLSISGLPSGVTAAIQTNPATYSSTILFTASSSAAVGPSTLTITGTSGTHTATATLQLNIVAPSFTIYSPTGTVTLNAGSSGPATIYVEASNGFNDAVSFAASELPSGVTASFSPTVNNASTLTLTSSSATAAGTYPITVKGTSGTLSATTTVYLTIKAAGYSLTAAPSQVTVPQGGASHATVSVIPVNGFAGNVNLIASGLPAGVTAAFSPNPTSGNSTLTLTASNSASAGTAALTITGTSGALTASTALAVTVKAVQTASATSLAITPKSSAAANMLVTATATVSAGSNPVTAGQVNFCDGATASCDALHLIGSAQITPAGTAVLRFIPGAGSHSYTAVFTGTNANTASTSAPSSLAVTASQPSTTAIAQSGSVGNYSLTATVTGTGATAPTGAVTFQDTTSGNTPLDAVPLVKAPATLSAAISQSPAVGSGPRLGTTQDFNEDGIPDLAVANSNSISILLGKGDGTFQVSATTLPLAGIPTNMVSGDFNHDGHVDLAASTQANNVNVFLGNGSGTFTATQSTVLTGAYPEGIAVSDFNGDGFEDMAVVNNGNATVTVQLGNGDGTFTPTSLTPQTGGNPVAVAMADFNGDGIQDLAVGTGQYTPISVLLGNGDGTFTSAQPVSAYASVMAVADFNLDGKPDLVAAANGAFTILLGNGDGSFKATASTTTLELSSLAVADFNGDGKPDIAWTSSFLTDVTTLLGNGDGTFTTGQSLATGSNPVSVVAGDWNRDGVTDMAVVNASASTVTVFTSALSQKTTATATGLSVVGTGTHAVNASYPGDSSFAASTSPTTSLTAVPVGAAASTVTVTASPTTITNQQTSTVTVTVSGGQAAPTGSVKLTGGTYSSAQLLAAGSASFAVPASALSAGANQLVATYAGDAAYASSSNTVSVTVAPFVISIPTLASVTRGSSATQTVTFTASNNYTGTLSLTCTLTSSPAGAQSAPTCSFNPSNVVIGAGGTGNATLTISTTAATAALEGPFDWRRFGIGGSALAALLLFGLPSRRRRPATILLLLLSAAIVGMAGCSSGGSGGGGGGTTTPPTGTAGTTSGNYTFAITATDSSAQITSTANVVLTVQ